jgi:hypothetical protein
MVYTVPPMKPAGRPGEPFVFPWAPPPAPDGAMAQCPIEQLARGRTAAPRSRVCQYAKTA